MLLSCTQSLKQRSNIEIFRTIYSSSVLLGRKRQNLNQFEEFPKEDPILNPLCQKKLRRIKHDRKFEISEQSKLLRVSMIGTTNSGKSTLINKLLGHHVCPESMKPNTTRSNTRAIMTEDDTQVIFLDTPGVVDVELASKYKMEDSLVLDPERSCRDTDLLIVLHDVSNRYVREAIDKKLLRLLALYYHSVPSILVLNKMDTIPPSRRVYDLIRKLTCNRLDGEKGTVEISTNKPDRSVETYLKRKAKESELKNEASVIRIEDIVQTAMKKHLTEAEVSNLTGGLVGWPGFRDVFTISALNGDGVSDLKQYLLGSAKDAPWRYPHDMKFDADPRDIVINIIKSKLLEHLPGPLPYKLQPVISIWEMEENWDRLNLVVTVDADNKHSARLILGYKGSKIKGICEDIQETLVNFFSHEVNFKLSVIHNYSVNLSKDKHKQTLKPNLYF